MIIVRSPMRISLGGGGTDVLSYANKYCGYCLSAAIDKYVYISLHQTFDPGITLKYSEMERVKSASKIQHSIFREALGMFDIKDPHLEIVSHADVPAGTGLGSSSSFTLALLRALHIYVVHGLVPPDLLAEEACHIEIECLGQPIGKQDQYISAYGGLRTIRSWGMDTRARVEDLRLRQETLEDLDENLLLFFTGVSRSASQILHLQDAQTALGDAVMIENLHVVKKTGEKIETALVQGKTGEFADLMNEHWQRKRERNATTPEIDAWYDLGLANGALGGKLVGAGGGGFLMFYAKDRGMLRQAMSKAGLKEMRFHFDFEGTKVICQ